MEAAACADSGGDPPPLLKLAWQCKRWNALPEAGGLMDQPAGLMEKLSVLDNVYSTMQAWARAKNQGEWSTRNPEGWGLVVKILKLRGVLPGG